MAALVSLLSFGYSSESFWIFFPLWQEHELRTHWNDPTVLSDRSILYYESFDSVSRLARESLHGPLSQGTRRFNIWKSPPRGWKERRRFCRISSSASSSSSSPMDHVSFLYAVSTMPSTTGSRAIIWEGWCQSRIHLCIHKCLLGFSLCSFCPFRTPCRSSHALARWYTMLKNDISWITVFLDFNGGKVFIITLKLSRIDHYQDKM